MNNTNHHQTGTGFTISHDNTIVRVSKHGVAAEHFEAEVEQAHNILRHFRMSQPGSIWGCDGVGYEIQKRAGIVCIQKSGVGPRKFSQGLKTLDFQV